MAPSGGELQLSRVNAIGYGVFGGVGGSGGGESGLPLPPPPDVDIGVVFGSCKRGLY